MRIALVNLSRFEDFSKLPEFEAGRELLERSGIELLDFVSGRSSQEALVAGFHEALTSDATSVLFACGGIEMIESLDHIDWRLVGSCNKNFIGLSDFTHFAWKAVAAGAQCYYGLALRDFVRHYKSPAQQKNGMHLLTAGKAEPLKPLLVWGDDTIDFDKARIVGGHSMISLLMYRESNIDLSDNVLFVEHHYVPGESEHELNYWGVALYRCFKSNRPRAILLGHSMLTDANGQLLPPEHLNDLLAEGLKPLNVPIYYVDHFKMVVPLSL